MKNIVLVGMMGSGKSSVGKLLAAKLSLFEFVDMDNLIIAKEKMSINEIFSLKGEESFRVVESQVAKELSTKDSLIISTGGGVVKNLENIQYLKQNGVTFYLEARADILYERVKENTGRPLLNNSDMKATIDNLLQERENSYKMSDYTVNTNNKSLEEVVEEIIELYKKYE